MKKRMLIAGLTLSLIVGLAACGSKPENGNGGTGTNQDVKQEEVNKDKEEEVEAPKPPEEKPALQKIICYYVDPETGNVVSEEVESAIVNEGAIWMELQNRGIITEECEVKNFEQNEAEQTIHLDVNKAFGDYVRGMGTTGETEVLKCVVNSYLDTYGCEKIKITEEGNVFETGHAVLDGYMGKQ